MEIICDSYTRLQPPEPRPKPLSRAATDLALYATALFVMRGGGRVIPFT